MAYHRPRSRLRTHEVTNQPPPLEDYSLFETDPVLKGWVAAVEDEALAQRLAAYGEALGRAETLEAGDLANRHAPELVRYDRYGQRVDEVRFHPAYHQLMSLGIQHEQHAAAWTWKRHGHFLHAALEYLMHQVEAGVCCPLSMTYAGVPTLKENPALAAHWLPKILSRSYDPRCRPLADKTGATIGMAMTEKQGGSDVRANATKAEPLAPGKPEGVHGLGPEYRLTGHKWFCSAPMSDGFFTLAYAPGGLTCFFVPRWTPEGERNGFFVERLKDKLGNRANASSEIEYDQAFALRIGEEGRGVKTIIQMVHHTRLDTMVGAASLMRRALVEAAHHARHRRAFQKTLIDHPLMQNVLADLALEWEAATHTALHVARAFDAAHESREAALFARLAVALSKYWLNKRVVGVVYECLEALGGAGYVEEAPLARIYREAPLNGIWEGSGNVIALDILRVLVKEPEAYDVFFAEVEETTAGEPTLAAQLERIKARVRQRAITEWDARLMAEEMALLLQAVLMRRHARSEAADAFIATRLAGRWGHAYGTLPPGTDARAILARLWSP